MAGKDYCDLPILLRKKRFSGLNFIKLENGSANNPVDAFRTSIRARALAGLGHRRNSDVNPGKDSMHE